MGEPATPVGMMRYTGRETIDGAFRTSYLFSSPPKLALATAPMLLLHYVDLILWCITRICHHSEGVLPMAPGDPAAQHLWHPSRRLSFTATSTERTPLLTGGSASNHWRV